MVNQILEKIKPYYTILVIIFVAFIFFALGRLSALETKHRSIEIINRITPQSANLISSTENQPDTKPNQEQSLTSGSEEVIGSKSGKKYYFPWCGTVKRIKPENQVHFSSISAAKTAGFTPGGNCKGLK